MPGDRFRDTGISFFTFKAAKVRFVREMRDWLHLCPIDPSSHATPAC